MNFKFKKLIYSFFGFLILLSIADRIDEYLLRQELKKKYLLGKEHSQYECFDIQSVKDHLLHKINIKNGFAKFCIRKEYSDSLWSAPFGNYVDGIIYANNRIVLPMKENWVENEFYVEEQEDENGNYRFPVPTADPKKRMYLKEEYR